SLRRPAHPPARHRPDPTAQRSPRRCPRPRGRHAPRRWDHLPAARRRQRRSLFRLWLHPRRPPNRRRRLPRRDRASQPRPLANRRHEGTILIAVGARYGDRIVTDDGTLSRYESVAPARVNDGTPRYRIIRNGPAPNLQGPEPFDAVAALRWRGLMTMRGIGPYWQGSRPSLAASPG